MSLILSLPLFLSSSLKKKILLPFPPTSYGISTIHLPGIHFVKPAVTPLGVKKAPMKAFPVTKAGSITSSGSTSKVGSSKAAVATATTQNRKDWKRRSPSIPRMSPPKSLPQNPAKLLLLERKAALPGKKVTTPDKEKRHPRPQTKAKRVAGELPSPTPMPVVRKPLYSI